LVCLDGPDEKFGRGAKLKGGQNQGGWEFGGVFLTHILKIWGGKGLFPEPFGFGKKRLGGPQFFWGGPEYLEFKVFLPGGEGMD